MKKLLQESITAVTQERARIAEIVAQMQSEGTRELAEFERMM